MSLHYPLASGRKPQLSGQQVQYGPGPEENAWVYKAASPGAPVCVWCHGGSWELAAFAPGPEDTGNCEYLQSQGFTVFDMNYPESDAKPLITAFPQQPNAMMTCAAYAMDLAAAFNGDPRRLVFCGGSSGAHIALTAGILLNKEKPGTVKAIAGLSPPTDLVELAEIQWAAFEALQKGESEATKTDSLLGPLAAGIGVKATELETPPSAAIVAKLAQWSPNKLLDSTSPPVFICGAENDPIVSIRQEHTMKAALEANGSTFTFKEVTGAGHALQNWNALIEGKTMREWIVSFFLTHA